MSAQRLLRSCAICLGLLFCLPATITADTESELRDAVTNMNSWLGADKNARLWRELLHLNVLDTQAAMGHRANPAALQEVASCFRRHAASANHPVFNHVYYSILAHIEQLQYNNISIDFESQRLTNAFQNLGTKDFDHLRSEAVRKIKLLKSFYEQTIPGAERTELYAELRPDETIDHLLSINFEVAPQRSRTLMQDEIRAKEAQIQNVEKQLQELNAQRTKIEEWVNGVKPPADADPPMPDDESNEQPQATDTPATTTDAVKNDQMQQELERIDSNKISLEEKKQKLLQQIEDVKTEIEALAESEKARSGRLRDQLRSYNRILARWETAAENRNDHYFVQTYVQLRRLKASYLAAANPNTPRQYAQRLKRLRKLHSDLLADPTDRLAAAELGFVSGWLDDAGQAQHLVGTIRNRYSQPNIFMEISSSLANKLASRNVSEYRRVHECILNRLIQGCAKIDGDVTVQFVPDPYQARTAIDFSGQIDSDTYTHSGRLTAYAGALGQFNVRREILANVGGMFACNVDGDLQLGSYFKCIDSKSRLVQKIARRKFHKTKPIAECISTERTKNKLIPQFREQTDTALKSGFEAFEKLNNRQKTVGGLIPSVYLRTDYDRLVVVGNKSTNYDLASPTQPADYSQIPSDVRLKLHESALSNYVSPILADKKFTNAEIAERFQELTGAEKAGPDDGEEISILFDDIRPVQFEFDNNIIAITISGKEFTRDGNRIRDGLRIRAAFRIVNATTHLELEPAEEVSVELIDKNQTNIRTVSFKNFLQDRLNDALNQAGQEKIQIPLNLIPADKLEDQFKTIADALHLMQCRMENGWMYLGWNHHSMNAPVKSYVVDTPAISLPTAPSEDASDIEPEIDQQEEQAGENSLSE